MSNLKNTKLNLKKGNKDMKKTYIKVVSIIEYVGIQKVGVKLKFRNHDGEIVEHIFPMSALDSPKTYHELLNLGFKCPVKEKKNVLNKLKNSTPDKKEVITAKVGWNKRCFVLPDETFGIYDKNVKISLGLENVYQETDTQSTSRKFNFEKKGKLSEWQEKIAKPAFHSPAMTLALCASATAPLLELIGHNEIFGFHFYSSTSSGKTTTLKVATSFNGKPDSSNMGNWDATQAGLEEMAIAHNGISLTIDETALLDKANSKIQKTIFFITNGSSRIRSSFYNVQAGFFNASWKSIFISAGEKSINELSKSRLDGEKVRVYDIKAISSKKHHIFKDIPEGFKNSKELITSMQKALSECYGSPLREYMAKITSDIEKNTKLIERYKDNFSKKYSSKGCNGMQDRIIKNFALLYAGGCLAIKHGIFPCNEEEIYSVISKYLTSTLKENRSSKQLLKLGLSLLKKKLKDPSVIIKVCKNKNISSEKLNKADGFYLLDRSERFYAIKPENFDRFFKNKDIAKKIKKYLDKKEMLVKGNDEKNKQVQIKGIAGKRRYVCIKKCFLED